jgi:hypothetical protein
MEEESKSLFSDAELVVMDALVKVCNEKVDMLKKCAEERRFDSKAYNALEVKENMLKAFLAQFGSAKEYMMRM